MEKTSSFIKNIFKNLIVGSPIEIYARSVIDSGNYEKINYERFNKLRDYKINYSAKPKKVILILSNKILKKIILIFQIKKLRIG